MEPPLDTVHLQQRLRQDYPDAERQLVIFRRQYFQRVDVKHITWPSAGLLAIYDVQRWIYGLTTDQWHSLSRTRQDYDVLAELVKRIEAAVKDAEEPDVYDPLVELCAELCMTVRRSALETAQTDVWVTYSLPSPPNLLREQTMVRVLEKPKLLAAGGNTGYRTWPAALALSSVIATQWLSQGLLSGKRVLELGAGPGLVSFVCATGGAEYVLATDLDEEVLRRFTLSKEVNYPNLSAAEPPRISCRMYEWATPLEVLVGGGQPQHDRLDIVLGADVTYDPTILPPLVESICSLIQLNPETIVVLAATIRNEYTFQKFCQLFDDKRLRTHLTEYHAPQWLNQSALFMQESDTTMLVTITTTNVSASTDLFRKKLTFVEQSV